MPKCRWDTDWEHYLTSRRQHDQHKPFNQSFTRGSQRLSPFNISSLTFQEGQQFPSSDLGPDLYTTTHWEQFWGTVPGNISKSSWEQCQKVPGNNTLLAWPKLRKGGVPGNSWEQILLTRPKMRVCTTFPGTFPGTKCPSSWEPGTFFLKRHDLAEAILGAKSDKQILFGCLGFLALPLWRCFVLPRRGVATSTPIKRPPQFLWESSSNHASATSWSECVHGQPFPLSPCTATGIPEKFRNRRDKDGVLKCFVFPLFLKIPRISWFSVDISLLRKTPHAH